jgi:hypothetical protein
MKKILMLMIIAAASRVAAAQCPVTLEKAIVFPKTGYFSVHGTNRSDKQIKAIEFGALLYNAMNDARDPGWQLVSSEKVKPGKEFKVKWDTVFRYHEESRGGAKAWVKRILFEDGSEWKDNGNQQCAVRHK